MSNKTEDQETVKVVGTLEIGGHNFNVYGDFIEPLFLATEVAKLLNERDGYTVARTLHESEKMVAKVYIYGKYKQKQNATLLTLSGLFSKIQKSEKLSYGKKQELLKNLKEIGLLKEITIASRKEIDFIDMLEQTLQPFNIKGVAQYRINNYRIDYYIPSFKVAIEYDENGHTSYTYEQQELRQEVIENELGCKFIRVFDDNSHSYNIGFVLKELLNVKLLQSQIKKY